MLLVGCAGPRFGLEVTGLEESSALQGDETASLAAGKTLDIDTGIWRLLLDLPVTRGEWAGLDFRLGAGARLLRGSVGAVSLSELEQLAPGVADLIVDTATDFDGFLSEDGRSFLDRGSDAFEGNLADRIELHDVGADVSFGLVATGPRFDGWGVGVLLPEFELAGIVHLSTLTIELTRADGDASRNRYAAFGFGIAVRVAPAVIVLPGDLRLQPMAARADVFALLTHKNLRAIVVSIAWSTQLSWSF